MSDPERVLFVHAHPDDETIDTGGTIATLIARGAAVTVLTCTRGERGEVMSGQPTPDSQTALVAVRMAELAAAMKILGVTDHRYLGDAGARWSGRDSRRYLDSGMSWGPHRAQPTGVLDSDSLDGSDLGEVAADVAAVLLDVSPSAVVSYDAEGGYGHPDHVRAHDAARRAAEIYNVPFYAITAEGAVEVDIADVLGRKHAALGAYQSQLTIEGDTIVFPGGQRQPIASVERYSMVRANSYEPVPFAHQHPAARFFAAVLAGVVGVALGALLTVYNQTTALVAGQNIWIGAIGAVATVAAAMVGFRLAFDTRIVPAFTAAGMILIVGLFSIPTLSASTLIPNNGPGILWGITPTVVALIVLLWPGTSRRRPGKIADGTRKATAQR